jgi:hypothetical protein
MEAVLVELPQAAVARRQETGEAQRGGRLRCVAQDGRRDMCLPGSQGGERDGLDACRLANRAVLSQTMPASTDPTTTSFATSFTVSLKTTVLALSASH